MYKTVETHKLMFNPMTLECKIIELNSSQLSYRGSTWTEVRTGTLDECETEMKKLK